MPANIGGGPLPKGSRSISNSRGNLQNSSQYWGDNMSADKREDKIKKSKLWRGNMVQVLMRKRDGPGVPRIETKDAKLVKIDCGGEKFITTEASLSRYPDTLLGSPEKRAKYYDPETGYHNFDRCQDLFSSILYFYQSPGTFRPPESADPEIVQEELAFFGIDIEEMIVNYDTAMAAKIEPVSPSLKKIINLTITDPSSNRMGMIWGAIDLVCIVLTISMLVLETIPAYKSHFEEPFKRPYSYKIAIYGLDVAINAFFTVDLIVKFASSENRSRFLFRTMNIMDILAVSPFYVELLVFITTAGAPPPQFLALKVCRIVRVVRVLKLVRHSKQLTEVMEVVSSAKQEFFVLIGVVAVVILLVGTIMYFVEYQIPYEGVVTEGYVNGTKTPIRQGDKRNADFSSILHGCWWAIVTITTVGYGDSYPRTTLGRLTGSFVVLFGIVVLAFPMTIIISKFSDSFQERKLSDNVERTRKLREMAAGCLPKPGEETSPGKKQEQSGSPELQKVKLAYNGEVTNS